LIIYSDIVAYWYRQEPYGSMKKPIIVLCTRITAWFLSFASDSIGSNQLMCAYLSIYLTASYFDLETSFNVVII
jgi:hypothetical protein